MSREQVKEYSERLRAIEKGIPPGWFYSRLTTRSSKLKMAELVQYYGTGRRKTAIARVYLRPGSGDFTVNGRAFEEYFVTPAQRSAAKSPLASSDTAATFNVIASVLGGGVRGQADAVKLGIARALMQFNVELRKKLKAEGMVSRDSRGKERKKYGQKGARKRFQFSKR